MADVAGFRRTDQAAFAVLSGDANPLHVDGEAARRLIFDRRWFPACMPGLGARLLAWRRIRVPGARDVDLRRGRGAPIRRRGVPCGSPRLACSVQWSKPGLAWYAN